LANFGGRILKENSVKLYMLANYLKENGISIQHFDGTILEEVIAISIGIKIIKNIVVKPVLRGHLWNTEKVAL
jgi:hypothetical protein